MQSRIIIHGGLSTASGFARGKEENRASLSRIAQEAFAYLHSHSALQAAVYAVSLLEDDPIFNAGTGSKLQSDGVIRMTASVMDAESGHFAGVINIRDVRNPVQVAAALLHYPDRVLAADEAGAFARGQGFTSYNPETPRQRLAYTEKTRGANGTVGCVALDGQGRLAAATSTGGKGFEIPGRVSDSATVAGNYATPFAAISCTGTGEDIVDAALASSIAARVGDGMSLQQACARSVSALAARGGSAGIIALDAQGQMCHAASDPYLTYAMHDGVLTVF